MKYSYLLTAVISVIIYSCSIGKGGQTETSASTSTANVEVTEQKTPDPDANIQMQEVIMAEGYVRDRRRKGCGYLIQVFVNDDSLYVEPLSMPEIHKENNKHVKLTYRVSKRQSTCEDVTPIVIDKIIG